MKAVEFYHCIECGKYPIEKIVNVDNESEVLQLPRCISCGGKTIFEKVREFEDVYG